MIKEAKICIILFACHRAINNILIVAIIIILIINNCGPTEKSIKKSLDKYKHNSEMIYSDYGDIFYLNNLYEYENDLLWIDDNHIIYQKDNKYYYVDNDIQKELLINNYINYGSLVYKDDYIYFSSTDNYFSYNIDSNDLLTIENEDYLIARDGNKYIVEASTESRITTFKIENTETSEIKVINNDTLNKNKLLKNINKVMKIRLFNYSIWDDEIYLHLYGGPYSIIVKYDFETGKIDYYDWFYREESRTCYLAFRINDKNNIPVLKDFFN